MITGALTELRRLLHGTVHYAMLRGLSWVAAGWDIVSTAQHMFSDENSLRLWFRKQSFCKCTQISFKEYLKKNSFFQGLGPSPASRLHGLMMIFQFAGLLSIMECFGSQSRIFIPSGSEVLCLKINVCPLCLLTAYVPTYNSTQARARRCLWQNRPIRF